MFWGGKIVRLFPKGAAAGGELAEQEFAPSRGLWGSGTAEKGFLGMRKVLFGLWELLVQHRAKAKTPSPGLGLRVTAFGSPKFTLLFDGMRFWLSKALSSPSHNMLLPLLSLGLIQSGFIYFFQSCYLTNSTPCVQRGHCRARSQGWINHRFLSFSEPEQLYFMNP